MTLPTFSHPSKTAALLIDVQSFEGMSRKDALAYSAALSERITSLRDAGVAIVWIGIAAGGAKLLEPSASLAPRSLEDLEEIGFIGHLMSDSNPNYDIYRDFMQSHGPRENEVVYRKPSMSALASAADIHEIKHILAQSGRKLKSDYNSDDHPETVYIEPENQLTEFKQMFGDQPVLHDYLQVKGFQATYLMGTISKYCITETAISSVVKGYETHVATDMVLSWEYPVTAHTRPQGKLVWENFDHAALIKESILTAKRDPTRNLQDFPIAKVQMHNGLGSSTVSQQAGLLASFPSPQV